jgi:hypothetical protein
VYTINRRSGVFTSRLAKIALAVTALGIGSYASAAQIYIDATETFLKTSTAQASSLPAASKCVFTKGQSFEIRTIADGGADHHLVTLPRAYAGCALTQGYIYKPHVATESTAVSVKLATVFKKTTASASTLPASSKCDMPVNVYALSGAPTTEAGHFKVNLKALLPNCSFSLGYVFDGHSSASILNISTSDITTFAKTNVDPATLPAADKCTIAKGNYRLTAAPSKSGTRYSVTMAATPAGCSFSTGFIGYEQTYIAGSAWCICRTVGTSPHIGQDWNANGTETSVAIANGSIVDKTFSSTCGHTLTVRDSGGADWIYRHLNSNSFQIGNPVTKGQTLGTHSAYPTSSCGTGPHLHIERRSAGAFNDSAVFKSCEAGPEPCNYDPNKPFNSSPTARSLRAPAAMVEDMTVGRDIESTAGCRGNPEAYGKVDAQTFAEFAPANKRISVVSEKAMSGQRTVLGVAAAVGNNIDNVCSGQGCLTSWSLVAETKSGWVRVFHDGGIRNRAAAVLTEESYCMPSNATGRAYILVTDHQGAKYRQQIAF